MQTFFSFGNCVIDDIVELDGESQTGLLGGNAVYSAAGIRLWGNKVSLISVIGSDFPEEHLIRLGHAGIDIEGVRRLDLPHYMRWRMYYFPDGRRTDKIDEVRLFLKKHSKVLSETNIPSIEVDSVFYKEIWPVFTPSSDDVRLDATSDMVFAHLAPGPVANNRAIASRLKAHTNGRSVVTLDWPWWDWDREGQHDELLLSNIDYLLPSIEEIELYANASGKDPFDAARGLLLAGPKGVIVKMGSNGARVLTRNTSDWVLIPAYPTRVVDTTGAGDSFCGGFLVGLAHTNDPIKAALYGAVSASFAIEDYGLLHILCVDGVEAQARLIELESMMK